MKIKGDFIRFVRSSGIFFLGNILSKAIAFLLLTMYTGYIKASDMGYYDVSVTYLNMVVSILFFEIWSAVLRFMYDYNENDKKYNAVKSGLIIFMGSTIVYLGLSAVLGYFVDIEHFILIIIYGWIQCIGTFYSFTARGLNHNIDFAVSGILNVVVNAAINILFIVYLNIGFVSMYYGFIFGTITQIIYLEIRTQLLAKSIKLKIDFREIKKMFIYAIPLCVNTVSYWLLTGFNRLVVNWVIGTEANGMLAIGNRFGTIITLVTTCFTYAWQDVSFSKKGNKKEKSEFYSNACNLYTKFLMAGLLVVMPLCLWVFELMINESYYEAKATIPYFLLVGVLSAISSFIGNVFYAIKDTKTIFISTVISAIVNVIIAFPLVKIWGMNGANISAAIGFLINILIRCQILRKKIDFKYSWITFIILLMYFFVVANKFTLWTLGNSILVFFIHLIICILLFRGEIKELFSKYF